MGLAAAMADFVSEHSRDSFWNGKDLPDFTRELFVLYVCIGNSTAIYYYLFSLHEIQPAGTMMRSVCNDGPLTG
jgi:hypothetical protein